MKYKIMYILVAGVEIIICLILCLTDNIHRYDSWTEVQATISDISFSNNYRPGRSSRGTDCFIIVDYNEKKTCMSLFNYSPDLNEGDVVSIKINPDNESDTVYIPYEKHRILLKRIKTSVTFMILIVLSLSVILDRKMKDPYDV